MLSYFTSHFKAKTLGDITWAHAVNSQERLGRFLNDRDIMVIESDILVSDSGEIIAAHPPSRKSDLALEDLLTAIKTSLQGLKLDFKDMEAVKPSLLKLQKIQLSPPVFLNADILQGPGGNVPGINAEQFIKTCQEMYSTGILSLGWTIGGDTKEGYSRENVDDMLHLCGNIPDVTFPVKASLLPQSWESLRLLVKKNGYSLTIWNKEPVSAELREWIQANTDPEKTMYDIIDAAQNPVKLL